MLIHSEILNPCKCGSKTKPDLDSDDMIPSWAVQCYDCGQYQSHPNNTMRGAVIVWNKENQLVTERVTSMTLFKVFSKAGSVFIMANNLEDAYNTITIFFHETRFSGIIQLGRV